MITDIAKTYRLNYKMNLLTPLSHPFWHGVDYFNLIIIFSCLVLANLTHSPLFYTQHE